MSSRRVIDALDAGAHRGRVGPTSRLVAPLRRRLPSARETLQAYLACLVPIVAWSVFPMLHDGLPGWSRQMPPWDALGVAAYVQAFALFESIVVFIPLVCLSLALPTGWFRAKFVALSTGLLYLSAAWCVFGQLNDDAVRTWSGRELLPWLGAYAASLLLLYLLIQRSSRVEAWINSFVHQVTVLAAVYLLAAGAAVVIVLIRNW